MTPEEQTQADLEEFIEEMIKKGAMHDGDIDLVSLTWYTSSTKMLRQQLDKNF